MDPFGRDEGVVDDDLHFEAPGPVGNDGSDFPKPDNAQDLVENLPALESFLVPDARFEGGGAAGNISREGKHHGDGVLGRGHDVAGRGIHDHDAPFGRRRDIDVVQTDPGPSDNLEPTACFQQVFGHLRRAADDQGVIVSDDGLELFRCKACFDVHINAVRFPKHLNPNLTQVVAYQYFHSFFPPHSGMTRISTIDGFAKRPISALRVSLVTAAYYPYASFLGIRKP